METSKSSGNKWDPTTSKVPPPSARSQEWSETKEKHRATPDTANIISSVIHSDELDTMHVPLLDLDINHHYVPSTTKGHAHLYLNVELNHAEYGELLTVLEKLGIIQTGILEQFKRDGMTQLRLPGKKKGTNDDLPGCADCSAGRIHEASSCTSE